MMNVYDFDDTIYNGDSSFDFVLFCFNKNKKLFKYIPHIILGFILYIFKIIKKTRMKEYFFSFLESIDGKRYVEEFWKTHEKNIKKFYLDNKKMNDLIISASPAFLLEPICEKLGIKNLIASEVDINSGKFLSENCKGSRKVDLFYEKYPNKKIREFYSDSLSDTPLANISRNAYLVDNENIKDWPVDTKSKKNYITNFFLLISACCFLLFNSFNNGYNTRYFIYTLFTAIIYFIIFIVKGKKDIFSIFTNSSITIKILSLISTYGVLFYVCSFYTTNFKFFIDTKLFITISSIVLFLLSIPICLIIISWIYSFTFKLITKAYKSINTYEKIIIFLVLLFFIIFALYSFYRVPSLYSDPKELGEYDLIYTSDTVNLLKNNCWLNIIGLENDIRQPLFALYSIPFVAPFIALFGLLSFLGIGVIPFIIEVSQIILLVITGYLLSLIISDDFKKRILFFLLFNSLYSTLLFSFMLEQYIVAVFYLVLLLYAYYINSKTDDLYVASCGTLSTSAILFPLLFNPNDRFYNKIKKIIKAVLYGIAVFILLNRVDLVVNLFANVSKLLSFNGNSIWFFNRVKQYTYFIRSIFIVPDASLINGKWVLSDVLVVNIIGIGLFLLSALGYYFNRNKKIAKISMYFVLFSLLLLCLVGWGTAENGLILYTLYFGWAFLILLYLLFEYLFNKIKLSKAFYSFILIVIICLFSYNFYYILDMISQLFNYFN